MDLHERCQRDDFVGEALRVEGGHGARTRVVDEPLDGYAATLEDRGWTVARVEARAGQGLRGLVVDALQLPVADLVRPRASGRVSTVVAAWRDFARPALDARATGQAPSDELQLEEDLHGLLLTLVQAAAAQGVGVGLLIDNASGLSAADLATVVSLSARTESARWPLQIMLAGLHT